MMVSFRMSVYLPMVTGLFFSGLLLESAYGQYDPRAEAEQREQREIERREERERGEIRREMERQKDEFLHELERLSEQVDDVRPHIGERAEAFDQRRREMMQREHHRAMLEGHRLDFEMHKLHMERVATQARIANDAVLSAAFALERLQELVPNEKERREVLEDFLEDSQNIAVQRLIRMKILELPAEGREREKRLEILEGLIP
ncbi:hypothetical protein Pan97_53510 [Bremerella volcania]|uniref:Uncharacterized protein n=1 Tax=Bremerella volcania TaxID=2527984 RepID=A0A518CGB1_9BACT|nr:hypothetical protein [Bremerella volcania]QDU78266.1 hypothetical protein Pan97_53510 [Bremerella volcania]